MEVSSTPRRRELTDIDREQVIVSLLQRSVNGVPRRGAVKGVAEKYQVSPRTISRLWRRAKEEEAKSGRLCAESRRRDRGRPMADLSAKLERLRITPLEQRSTLRSAALSCGVSRATLQRRVKDGKLVAHTSNVKLLLTEENKLLFASAGRPQETFADAVQQQELDIELCCQPPNSPGLNCLDLGLFAAIQARQRLRTPRSFDELIDAVTAAYWELPPSTINAAFLSLQGSMDLCIQDTGGNTFKPPHMAKAKLQREGRLPLSLQCSPKTAVIVSQRYREQTTHHS
ncbi:Transposase, Tc1-like protein [Phytophthora cinnamomi]|uniref:Transposase, Tc1-like protein n=1 Tax=Phytophthora cinnamomi TaxID=4785 RepID=UPI00355A6619|nr:Transposase, Tc1-like protein [Phytophthora cinnamomi]